MNIWERIKRLWATAAPPDHPLTEKERECTTSLQTSQPTFSVTAIGT